MKNTFTTKMLACTIAVTMLFSASAVYATQSKADSKEKSKKVYQLKEKENDLQEKKAEIEKKIAELKKRKEEARKKYSDSERKLFEENKKLIEITEKIKTLSIDSVISKKNRFKFDVPPVIKENRTLIPVRAIAEGLGATVTWNGEEHKVTITKGANTIILTLGSNIALVNGKEVAIDTKTCMMSNRTYVPLRFIAEQLGLKVNWDQDSETVDIDDDDTTVTPAPSASPSPTEAPAATATPAPTEVPAATATPAPTEVPAATATPAPTEVPAATATPAPTEVPAATATPAPTAIPAN